MPKLRRALLVIPFALAGCASQSWIPIQVASLRQPDINQPTGYAPIMANDVRFLEPSHDAWGQGPEPQNCVRIGAVYANFGMGDWILNARHLRPRSTEIQWRLREEAGKMGANALAWSNHDAEALNHALAFRCP